MLCPDDLQIILLVVHEALEQRIPVREMLARTQEVVVSTWVMVVSVKEMVIRHPKVVLDCGSEHATAHAPSNLPRPDRQS